LQSSRSDFVEMTTDVTRGADGSGARDRRGLSPTALAYGVGPVALAILLVCQHFGLVAEVSPWLYVAAIAFSQASSVVMERWRGAPVGSWALHLRVATHVASVTWVIYLTGWGPALGMAYAFSAFAELEETGYRAWRAALLWSVVGFTVGEFLVFVDWMPSFLSTGQAATIGFLGMFVFAIAIRMVGSIGERQERADRLVALARDQAIASDAEHRAVIDNAAEGILTINADGTIASFNSAAETMFGWSANDVIGKPATMLVPTERAVRLEQLLHAYQVPVGELPRTKAESIGLRRDGSEFPMMVSTSPIVVHGVAPKLSGIVRDLTEQKAYEVQLAHQVMHDSLTGLPNRAMLADRLDHALARATRDGHPFAVLFVDLDRFKSVNDVHGHTAADHVLVETARRICSVVREADTVARLGGDEFVVLCEDLETIQNATVLADRIISAIELPFAVGDDEVHISASVGIALSSDPNVDADAMVTHADIAMYRAKQGGRGRYELFDEAMQHWLTNQRALEADLRVATARNELRLLFQPIVESATGSIRGFEALLRWDRPGYGVVAPDDFIPIAEETGLIVEIGGWVLQRACEAAAAWAIRWPERTLGVAVNISGRQLRSGDLVNIVRDTLDRTGLDPARLSLELTESTLVDDALSAQAQLAELRAVGVNLSLDDFGTQYSSLTYLRTFPINVVKIDRSFVGSIGTEREDTAIVAAVLALARNLDVRVVAEGIETPEQLAVLVQLDCPFLQGYLFSPPIADGDIPALLDTPILLTTDATAR
jgi:diguanylate cyclase (GGDEF)-like protein/PAS domain S-box-containing protein